MDPTQSNLPLTDVEKMELRRQMGYPAIGASSGGQSSWRFFSVYGQMEFRFNNMQPCELQNLRTFLAQLAALEAAYLGASDNLDTAKAAVWAHNPNELRNRRSQYNARRKELCSNLDLPPGPGLCASRGQIII